MQAREIILIIAMIAAVALFVYYVWTRRKIFLLEEIEKSLYKAASQLFVSPERTLILGEANNCRRLLEKLNRRQWFIVGALCVLLLVFLILIRC